MMKTFAPIQSPFSHNQWPAAWKRRAARLARRIGPQKAAELHGVTRECIRRWRKQYV